MSNHSVTIELPEHIFQRLSLLAETTARPLAEIVAQSVVSNLPPEIDKSSPEL
jgi:predicted transcriptional regulator